MKKRLRTVSVCLTVLLAGCNWSGLTSGTADSSGAPFVAFDLVTRTFTEGSTVATQTFDMGDAARVPRDIDFNGDGMVDPVVGYGGEQAVVQLMLSQAGAAAGDFLSLTLDSFRDMQDLSDLAVGDINNDGRLDIMAGAATGVWYLRHPLTPQGTTDLRYWQIDVIDVSAGLVDLDENAILQLVQEELPPGASILDYEIVLDTRFTNVEIADVNADSHADVIASRYFQIQMNPLEGLQSLEPIAVVGGDIALFLNPGNAADGANWDLFLIGRPERQDAMGRFDREGASGLIVIDVDGDTDFDLVSSARLDNNVQVAWFENPGTGLVGAAEWVQWRVGSVRDAFAIDVADLTGDGRLDVVATGSRQLQVFLFTQPASGPKREFDWDSSALATFENYTPRDIRVVDYDVDGTNEIIVGATLGAIRRFDPPGDPAQPWAPGVVMTFSPAGEVGLLGVGDIDGDGDPDFVAVLDADSDNDERLVWIRNDT